MSTMPTITFYDYHKPSLPDGHYAITVQQTVTISGTNTTFQSPGSTEDGQPPETLDFYVEGPRFAIDHALVHSVYPPVGGKGNYRTDLPSIVLNRSTLPWERWPMLSEPNHSASWLFLLLIDESEISTVIEHNNAPLNADIRNALGVSGGDGRPLPATINYLTVATSLKPLFPKTIQELEYLSYVRMKDGGEEKAVLLGNRLPKENSTSTVYLVSLENNYQGSGGTAQFTGITQGNSYILPYLYKWQFHTFQDELYVVSAHIANQYSQYPQLKHIVGTLYTHTHAFAEELSTCGVNVATDVATIEQLAKLKGSTFHGLLSSLSGGFQPFNVGSDGIHPIQATGTAQLHYQRLGTDSNAVLDTTWYRGPLAACPIDSIAENFPQISHAGRVTSFSSPTTAHDMILTASTGERDTSYAAAWELGRLTALNDKRFSTAFYQWKSAVAAARRLAAMKGNSPLYPDQSHLPVNDHTPDKALPPSVQAQFDDWKRLRGIPYRYLVPDPTLLPSESIRFFRVDANWINAFISGAFSIGHTVAADLSDIERSLYQDTSSVISGFLINSLVVSGWPDFDVDASLKTASGATSTITVSIPPSAADTTQGLLTAVNMDVDIRLYLFRGAIEQLKFHLHPAKTHSGFVYNNGGYIKSVQKKTVGSELRTLASGALHFIRSHAHLGHTSPDADALTDDEHTEVIHVTPDANNVVNIKDLTTALKSTSIAEFASQMLAGTPVVVFTVSQ